MTATDIGAILDELGKRLGPAGSHVFDLAVRQVYVDGFVSSILFAITIIFWFAMYKRLRRWWEDDDEDVVGLALVVTVMGIVLTVITFVLWIVNAPPMLNPEYAALKDLLAQMKHITP